MLPMLMVLPIPLMLPILKVLHLGLPSQPHSHSGPLGAMACRISCNVFYLENVGKGLQIRMWMLHVSWDLRAQLGEYSILAPEKFLGSPNRV